MVRAIPIVAVWLWLAPAGAGEAPAAIPDKGAGLADTEVKAVAERVAELRGLPFKEAVPVAVVSQAAAREYAVARLERFASPEDLAAEERAYVLLGILPPGVSIVDAYTRAIEEVAFGYYDPESRSFFLLDHLPEDASSLLAAHELTHALEDQHFGLDRRLEAVREDSDRAFAVMAVHEGSASLLMSVYTARALREGWLARESLESLARAEAVQGDKLGSLAPLLRRPLLGAYVLGAMFLARGDARALAADAYPIEDANRIYADGPVSSEQILHPEKYWDPAKRDPPKPVPAREIGPILGDGWGLRGSGTLGELFLGTLVDAPTPAAWTPDALRAEAWTNAAAAGWGGDRWEIWTRGDAAVVLLETVWDTAADAREFEKALRASRPGLGIRRRGARVAAVAGDPGRGKTDPLLRALVR